MDQNTRQETRQSTAYRTAEQDVVDAQEMVPLRTAICWAPWVRRRAATVLVDNAGLDDWESTRLDVIVTVRLHQM